MPDRPDTEGESLAIPDYERDGVPVDDTAEPDDAGVEHTADPAEVERVAGENA